MYVKKKESKNKEPAGQTKRYEHVPQQEMVLRRKADPNRMTKH